MKKLTFLLLAALSGLTASAQTEKGSQWIGGSISASHDNQKVSYSSPNQQPNTTRKTSEFSIGPSYSYFIADNLGLSGTLGYSNSTQEDASNIRYAEQKYNTVFGSIALNKYALYEHKIGVRFGPFANYNYGKARSSNSEPDYGNYSTKQRALTTGLSLDFVYFPVKQIGMVAGIGSIYYQNLNYDGAGSHLKQNGINLNIMSSTTFSLYYAF